MKTIRVSILALSGILAAIPAAHAQQGTINAYYSVGTATDSSSNQQIDTFGTGSPFTTPKLGGLFSDIGASIGLTNHWGIGGDLSWRDSRAAYAGLQYRPLFYNFDAIYTPGKSKRFVPEFRGGLGGVSVGYSFNQTLCDQFVGCSTANQGVESSHHFQVHMEVAARYYVHKNLFLRPAVEAHYVNNFFQFGSNWVPQYSMGIGYTFGNRE